MGESHAVFGIESRWRLAWRDALDNSHTSAYPSMEELTAPYVTALHAHAGSKRCVLAGFSFAGLIAFEAAHQLRRLGGRAELVILIDTRARPLNPYQLAWNAWRQNWKQDQNGLAGSLQSLPSRIRSAWHTAWWLLGKAQKRLRPYLTRTEPNLTQPTGLFDEHGVPIPWGLAERLYREIDRSYQLRRLSSRGVLLRTDEIEGRRLDRNHEDALGWEGLFTQGLEVVPIPGDHSSIFLGQASIVAKEVNRALSRCTASKHEINIDAHEGLQT
jgi:thioesterase domain-containing protein